MPHDPYSLVAWLGYLYIPEVECLKRLAKELPQHAKIVNIGAGGGTSGLIFRSTRPDAHLYTCDIQFESSPFGCIEAEIQQLKENNLYDEKLYSYFVGDSKEIGKNWQEGKIDMVFVDGDHSYEGASGDISIWLKNLKPGGIIAVHDFEKEPNNKPYPGVDKAVYDLLRDKYEFVETVATLTVYRNNKVKAKDAHS